MVREGGGFNFLRTDARIKRLPGFSRPTGGPGVTSPKPPHGLDCPKPQGGSCGVICAVTKVRAPRKVCLSAKCARHCAASPGARARRPF